MFPQITPPRFKVGEKVHYHSRTATVLNLSSDEKRVQVEFYAEDGKVSHWVSVDDVKNLGDAPKEYATATHNVGRVASLDDLKARLGAWKDENGSHALVSIEDMRLLVANVEATMRAERAELERVTAEKVALEMRTPQPIPVSEPKGKWEVKTLVQYNVDVVSSVVDNELAKCLNRNWEILNITVLDNSTPDDPGIFNRIVTLKRWMPDDPEPPTMEEVAKVLYSEPVAPQVSNEAVLTSDFVQETVSTQTGTTILPAERKQKIDDLLANKPHAQFIREHGVDAYKELMDDVAMVRLREAMDKALGNVVVFPALDALTRVGVQDGC